MNDAMVRGLYPFELPRSETAQALAAWCVFLFRHHEQERVHLDLCESRGGVATNRRLTLELSAEMPASEAQRRAAEALAAAPVPGGPALAAAGLTLLGSADASPPSIAPVTRRLHLVCRLGPDSVACELHYDASRFGSAAIAQYAEQLKALFRALVDQPATRLACLPLLDATQARALRQRLTGPAVAPAELPVFRAFERQAREQPHSVAVTLNGVHLTYAELNRRANACAHWLLRQGLSRGARVAVCLGPSIEFVVCMLGILKAGATHVPLEPSYPDARLRLMLEDVGPALAFTDAASGPKLAALGARVVDVEAAPAELFAGRAADPELTLQADDTAYIVYTSGSTGKPKGVMVSHGNLAHYIDVARRLYGYGPGDSIPAMARFTFSITFFELLSPLASGARLVLLERGHVLDLPRLASTLTELTCVHASPSLWRRLLAHLDAQGSSGRDFPALRHVSSGGDMVSPDLVEALQRAFPAAEVFVIYGCSEISCMGSSFAAPRARSPAHSSVGKAFPNTALRLLDPSGQLVPPGVVGEVYFGGAGVALGYLNRPELTAERFVVVDGEPLYRTGDLGRLDAETLELELVGRSDFQVKLRGMRIEPIEIETQLRGLAGVRDALVAAPVLTDGERQLVAYLVPNGETVLSARRLREALAERLPDYMVPSVYVELDALPVNVNQKVDRLALAGPPPSERVLASDYQAPRTGRERELTRIWQEVLGIPRLGVRDDFFASGGDSLRALTLVTRINQELGAAVPASVLLSAPTVERLAEWLDSAERQSAASSGVVSLRRGTGSKPPVFFIHGGHGETITYLNLARLLHPGHSVYGLAPKGTRDVPMLHTRIADAVRYYAEQIQAVAPAGPYLLGGLCIGGFLAFEVGRYLRASGHAVGPIALLDAAHVTTAPIGFWTRSLGQLKSELAQAASGSNGRVPPHAARVLVRRARDFLAYAATTRIPRHAMRAKLPLLRFCIDHGLPVPAFLRHVSVDATLRFAEKEYVNPGRFSGEILLFRPTRLDAEDVSDVPYARRFVEPELGWAGKASELRVYDVPGGHFSHLHQPHVRAVARLLQARWDEALAGPTRGVEAASRAEAAPGGTTRYMPTNVVTLVPGNAAMNEPPDTATASPPVRFADAEVT
jgi:amino acid adenylation domain-containing protein